MKYVHLHMPCHGAHLIIHYLLQGVDLQASTLGDIIYHVTVRP